MGLTLVHLRCWFLCCVVAIIEDVGIDIDIETSVSININISIITVSIDRIIKIISLIHITIHTKTLTTAPTLASPPAALRRPAWGLYSKTDHD